MMLLSSGRSAVAQSEPVNLPDFTVLSPRVANQEPVATIATPVSALRYEPMVDLQARNFAEGQAERECGRAISCRLEEGFERFILAGIRRRLPPADCCVGFDLKETELPGSDVTRSGVESSLQRDREMVQYGSLNGHRW
jgi:hypothetical protein